MIGQKLHKTLLSVRHPKFQKTSKGSQRHRTEMHASVDTYDSTLLGYKYLILSSIFHASSTTKLKPKSPSTDPEIPKQSQKSRRSTHLNNMPRRLSSTSQAESSNDNNVISTVPPTAPAATSTIKSAVATQHAAGDVTCCKCGRLVNWQSRYYCFTCRCGHNRCDNCRVQ